LPPFPNVLIFRIIVTHFFPVAKSFLQILPKNMKNFFTGAVRKRNTAAIAFQMKVNTGRSALPAVASHSKMPAGRPAT